MANVLSGNVFHVTSASSANTDVLESEGVQVVGIIFTSATASATFELSELSLKGAEGEYKLKASLAVANDTLFIRLADSPITFSRGIFVKSISSGSLSLIIKPKT